MFAAGAYAVLPIRRKLWPIRRPVRPRHQRALARQALGVMPKRSLNARLKGPMEP